MTLVGVVASEATCIGRCSAADCRAVQITPGPAGVACSRITLPAVRNRRFGVKQSNSSPVVTSSTSTTSSATSTATTSSTTSARDDTTTTSSSATIRTGTQGTAITTGTTTSITTTTTSSALSTGPPATTEPAPKDNGAGDSKPLVVGLAVTGSIVGALLIGAIVTYSMRMSRKKGLDNDVVYTLPWRKSGLFSASAGVGAASVVNGAGGGAASTIPRTPPTVGRGSTGNYYSGGGTLYPPNYQQPSQEGFTMEQYLAAGWTIEQINTFNPPILPSDTSVSPLPQ
ncbi:hypothetical protein HDU67_008286 [Dinochytrium kinnereticum]|nr:hypothetical protein HDU67_008286 [Dinochytrium kinnereticum]